MRKKLTIAAILVIVLALLAAGTWAFFTTEGETTNVITTGNIKLAISEKQLVEGGEIDYTTETITGVMPSREVSKIVRIENTGDNDLWARARVNIKVVAADGETELGNEPVIAVPGSGWDLTGDWYYYINPVDSGDATMPLIESVKFSEKMGNEYQGCTVTVTVEAQGVQVANNPADNYIGAAGAAGWPDGGFVEPTTAPTATPDPTPDPQV